MQEVLIVLIITGLACSILGPFIVLRNLSMAADAISHSVLLGIVIAFYFTKDLNSPFLIIGAGIFGVLTVLFVELLSKYKLVKKDDALGIVFPLFLSIAVVIISKYFRNVHIDTDMVLMGNPLFSPFIKVFDIPKSALIMFISFIINLVFIIMFYNELKISTFDEDYAKMKNINTTKIFYILMTLTSFTCVNAFDSVGAILVISFFVTPATIACLISKDLKKSIILTLLITILNCIVGFYISIKLNVSISGMCSFIFMISLFLFIIFNPKGIIYKKIKYIQNHKQLHKDLILIHMYKHKNNLEEIGVYNIHRHLNWEKSKSEDYINSLIKDQLVIKNSDELIYELTLDGEEYVKILLGR